MRNSQREGDGVMRIECPHCRVMIDVVEPTRGSDVQCPQCGSRISSEMAATIITPPPSGAGLQPAEHSQESPAGQVENLPHKTRPQPIEIFGRFQLLKKLGSGSYGEVFWAYDPSLDRDVAIKRPHAQSMSPEEIERFLREARAAAQLKNKHIVGVYEVNEVDGRPYIASEYIVGIDLAKLIEAERDQNRIIPFRQTAQLCGQVAEALHLAHEAGIVHRDLKPANIMVGDDGLPRVMDFGMAKRESEAKYVLRTGDNVILGTPAYMSPEQWQGKSHDVDRRADVYALGVILFELLTGERPFRGERDRRLLQTQVLNDDAPTPSKLNSQVPADLDTLCLKCLEKDPSRRFPTAAALAQELHRFLHGEPIHSRPITQWERARKWCQRNPMVASLSAAVALSLLIGTVVSSYFAVSWYYAALAADKSATEEKKQTGIAKQTADDLTKTNDELEATLARSNFFLAVSRWEQGRAGEAQDFLGLIPEKHRHWEWYYSKRQFSGSGVTLYGHASGLTCLTHSPDGQRLASASQDTTIKLWDAISGAELRTLTGHTHWVKSVSFSPDGQLLASASSDHTIKLWDTRDGTALRTLTGHTSDVFSVSFSPNGQQVVSASSDRSIKLWDTRTGAELRTLTGHTTAVTGARFSPDGQRIASASSDHTIKLWNARSGAVLHTLIGHTQPVGSVSFSPDGQRLASAGWDNTVKLWDVHRGAELRTFIGHTNKVLSVSFSPDGQRLASASLDNTIKLWDVHSGAELRTLIGHTDVVSDVSFSLDGQRLASASQDTTIKLWDTRSNAEFRTLIGHTNWVSSVSFSKDGKQLASASGDHTLKLWDARSGLGLRTLIGHTDAVSDVSFSPDGHQLASASADHTVKLWDARSNIEVRTFSGHTGPVRSVSFSADGQRLASASVDNSIKLWDVRSGIEVRTLTGHIGPVTSVRFSPNGQWLASASLDRTVKLWDANSGRSLRTLTSHTLLPATNVSFSPDSQWLASAGMDNTIKLWDAKHGEELRTFTGHTQQVLSVSFSPDGQRLASAGMDKTMKLWDANSGAELRTLIGHMDGVRSVSFSPDGQQLASASQDKTLKLWDALSSEDLSSPVEDELLYRAAQAKLDPWWQWEQAAKAEGEQAWYAVTFHRTWMVKAKPNDSAAWHQLQTAATKTTAAGLPLPPITVELFQARNEPLPTKKAE